MSEEVSTLRRENTILSHRLQTTSDGAARLEGSPDREGGASSPKLLEAKSKKDKGKGGRRGGGRGGGRCGGSILTVSSSTDGFETVTMSPDERGELDLSHTLFLNTHTHTHPSLSLFSLSLSLLSLSDDSCYATRAAESSQERSLEIYNGVGQLKISIEDWTK